MEWLQDIQCFALYIYTGGFSYVYPKQTTVVSSDSFKNASLPVQQTRFPGKVERPHTVMSKPSLNDCMLDHRYMPRERLQAKHRRLFI